MVGFDAESKAYRCFVPETKKFVISRDVKFVHDFTQAKSPASHLSETNNNKQEVFVDINFDEPEEAEQLIADKIADEAPDPDTSEAENYEAAADESLLTDDSFYTPKLRRTRRSTAGVPPERFTAEISVVINGEPSTFNEAISCDEKDHWLVAMEEEYAALMANNTWKLVDLPNGKNLVSCKWVFKLKTDADGAVKRYKARLVARGFSQKYGVDYDQVFAPVARHSTFRVLLSTAASNGMMVYHFDAKSAFLNGELEEDIYMSQPPGFIEEGNEKKVCHLMKSIYGLKQSARIWSEKLHKVIIEARFTQSEADSCLYTYKGSLGEAYLLVYVDDILVISQSSTYIGQIEQIFKSKFNIENLGLVANYLGIRVTKNENSFYLDQQKYIQCIARKFELENSKPTDIPLSPSYHNEPESEILPSNDKYRAAIGCLLYVSTNTRPDVSAAVAILSQKVAKPTQNDWCHVKNLIRYLKSTSTLRLKLGDVKPADQIIGYADASWAEDRETRKSNSDYIFLLNGTVSWLCKRQDCVSLSSTEAEFIALSEACKESVWLQRLVRSLHWSGNETALIYEDNQSVLKIIVDEKLSSRTKHIDTKIHFVKDYVEKRNVNIQYCPTEEMLADLFTKGLAKAKFEMFRKQCNLVNIN